MIENKVKELIALHFNLEEDELKLETSFEDDLKADSLDLVGLLMALEDEFGLEIEDEDIDKIKTIANAVEYIEKATK